MNSEILRKLSYGMCALGVRDGAGRPNACIVNTVIQITVEPVEVAVCVHRDNYSFQCMKETGEFAVSVFSEEATAMDIAVLGFKSGRDADKLVKADYRLENGLPVLNKHICCWFRCRVTGELAASTHTLFIAEVVDGSDEAAGIPMTYEYYHRVIKGKAPKNAPHA